MKSIRSLATLASAFTRAFSALPTAARVTALALLTLAAGAGEARANTGVEYTAGSTSGNPGNYTMGYRFITKDAITVTHLGYWDNGGNGLTRSHEVGLWNSSGTLLASATVPSGTAGTLDGHFRYVALATSITLAAGQTFTVGGLMTSGDTDGYLYQPTGITSDISISYLGGVLRSGSTLTLPNSTPAPYGYFGGNIKFDPQPFVVKHPTSQGITATGAALGGTVVGDGGSAITERGVVYAATATNAAPAIGGAGVTKVTAAGTVGAFTVPVTGLTVGTSYSYKAYAINATGTIYTSAATFSPTPGVIFNEGFFTYHGGISNGGQYGSNSDLFYAGVVPAWAHTGANAIHAIDRANSAGAVSAPRNYAVMIFAADAITQSTAIAGSNASGVTYYVNYDAAPAIYQAPTQGTAAADGLIVEVIRGAGTVLGTHTTFPGVYNNATVFAADGFSYVGDGSGDIKLKVRPVRTTSDTFAGAIDNLTVSTSRGYQNGSFETNGGQASQTATGWVFTGGQTKVVNDEGITDGVFAMAFNTGTAASGGRLSQTFATVTGQTYTIRFDFGAYGVSSSSKSELGVEMHDGTTVTGGTQIIDSGSGTLAAGTSGVTMPTNAATITVKDLGGSAATNAAAPSAEFAAVSFTFTALSPVSTLVFIDTSTGGADAQDAILDNVRLTAAVAPVATTGAASDVAGATATVGGIVNANATNTTITFEYGTTTGYGQSAAATPSTLGDTTATAVSAALTGLAAHTTYHFRLKAVNAAATAFGEDATFTTTNTAPTATAGSVTTVEDTASGTITLTGADADGDALSFKIATLPASGTLKGNGTAITTVPTTVLAPLTYTPNADFSGSDSFTFQSNDGTVDSAAAAISVTVMAVNDAPVVTTTSGSVAYTENDAATVIDAGLTVSDGDNASLTGATVQIAGTVRAENVLGFTTQNGITGTFVSGTGVLTLSGTATVANYQTALRTVTYFNNSEAPNSVARTVNFTVNDGTATASASRGVAVTVVDDTPVLSAIADQTVNEDTATAALAFTVTHADSPPGGTAVGTSSNQALVLNTGILFGGSGGSRTVQVTPVANQSGTTTITISKSDNTSAGTTSFVVTVTSVNDAPTATNLSAGETYMEDTVRALNDIVITDAEAGDTLTATLTLSNTAAGSLTTGTSGAATSTFNAGTGVWSASGARTDVNALLAGVSFTPALNFNANFTIATSVSDGFAAAATGSKAITGTARNDAPTLAAITDPAAINEDAAAQTVGLAGIGTGAANETQVLTVTATSSNPALIPNPTVTYTSPGATGSLSYTLMAETSGSATITVTVTDDGGVVGGGINTTSQTFTVAVTAVNDAPTLAAIANPAAINEDAGAQTVNLSGIGTGAANETQTLTVTATSGNAALIANPSVTYSSPGATGTLTYTPIADANGTALVTVTVGDGALTTTQTFTVMVTPVNDAPVVQGATVNVQESSATGAAVTTVVATDVDTGQTMAYSITAGNTGTAFAINATTGAITLAAALDFEATPSYALTVRATDNGTPVLNGTATITVNVSNVNEPPVVAVDASGTTAIFSDDFSSFTAPAGNFNGAQYQSGRAVVFGGTLTGWTKGGSGTVHGVDLANANGSTANPRDVVPMLYRDNVITQTVGSTNGNLTGKSYRVDYVASPATYGALSETTTASDGVIVEVIHADGSVLATQTTFPGAWAGNMAFAPASFTYTGDGNGVLRLRVKASIPSGQNRFGGAIDNLTITQLNTATTTGAEGAAVTQTGTFSDPDGNATVTLTATSGAVTQNNSVGTWSWSPAAGFDGPTSTPVTITATDSASLTATAPFTFTATNAAPTVTISAPTPATPNEDASVSFTFAATDAATADQTAGFAWSVNYGDGTGAQPEVAGTASPLTRTHTFATPGTFSVTVTATDKNAGESAVATRSVTIADITAPVFTSVPGNLTASATTTGGAFVTYAAATATDNSGVAPAITYSAASGALFAIGTTTVTVTATDGAGLTTTATFTVTVTSPEIAVEQPAGTDLADGASTVSFGATNVGSTADRTFTISNVGSASLTGLGITIDGANASEFSVVANPTAPIVAGGAATTFTVRFAPTILGGGGTRTAALHIASNDLDEASFDIALTGGGIGDTTAPETAITSTQPSPTNTTGATITFTGSDDITPAGSVTFEGKLDGGNFAAVTSPLVLSDLSEGTHTYHVRARDLSGNVDGTPASVTWTVDVTAPDTTLIMVEPDPTNDTTGDFQFSANEAGSTFAVSVDGGAFAQATSPFSTPPLADGSHTFAVRATDAAGNMDGTPATATWTVDTAAPDTTLTATEPSPTNDTTGDFAFSSNEAGANFMVSVDGGAFVPAISPFSTAVLAEGIHTLAVQATDRAGNIDATPATATWVVDTTAPAITAPANQTAEAAGATGTSVTYADATATDSVTANPTITYSKASGALFAIGTTTVSVTATDEAGNESQASFTVTVRDTVAPVVTQHATVIVEATDANGAIAAFTPTATDAVGVVSITSTPASGSLFALGDMTVQVVALDAAGNEGMGSFTVTVQDTTAPTLTAPAGGFTPLSLTTAPGEPTAPLPNYAAQATVSDAVGATATQSPAPGTALAPGSHAVTVSAADAAGNMAAPLTFNVTVVAGNAPPVVAVDGAGGAPVFSTTGSLAGARSRHTATLLPSGKVLVAGGFGSDSVLANAELYDPATNTWSAAGSLATARFFHTATLLANGQVLVAGGSDSSFGPTTSAELYDPAANTWSAVASLATARVNHTATLLANGQVLVVGGSDSGNILLASAELFDPAANAWSAAGSLATERRQQTATLLANGQVLVAGGFGSNGALASAELYDPATNTWSAAGSLATARDQHTATLLADGQVLVAGGLDSNFAPSASAERYDPAANVWSAAGSLATGRRSHTATVLANGHVLVAGGTGNSVRLASAERYDPAVNVWSAAGNLGTARRFHTATLLPNGKVLVAGGFAGNVALASAEIYGSPAAVATGAEGTAITQTGTFSDADGNATVTLTASSGTVTQDNTAGTWSWSPSAGFDGPAETPVTITATDNAATPETSTAEFTFAPTNAPPAVSISGPASADEDAAVAFAFAATDASGADQTAGFAWSVDAGDGFGPSPVDAGTASPLSGSYSFATPGTYTLTVTATDEDGGTSTAATHQITILDKTAPVFSTVSGNLTAEATSAEGAAVTYAAATATDNSGATPAITYSHASGSTFSAETATTVTVTATDAAGRFATATFTVTVGAWAPVEPLFLNGSFGAGGAPVPGEPAGTTLRTFGAPAINDARQVAFAGTLRTAAGAVVPAIFAGRPAVVVVRKGDASPVLSGASFASFLAPMLAENGRVAFHARLGGASTAKGLYTNAFTGSITEVARPGMQAPGTGGGVFSSIGNAVLSPAGDAVFFLGTLVQGTGTPAATKYSASCLWVARGPGDVQLLLRAGTLATLGAHGSKTVSSITAIGVRTGAAGHGRGAVTAGDTSSIWVRALSAKNYALGTFDRSGASEWSYTTAAAATTPPGYSTGTRWLSFAAPAQNGAGAGAFVGTVKGPQITSTNDSAIFAEDNSFALAVIAREGAAAVGIDGATYGTFEALATGGVDGTVPGAIRAGFVNRVRGGSNLNLRGLWYRDETGATELVARTGGPAAGVEAAATWKTFSSIALPEGTGPLFLAKLSGATVNTDTGLWTRGSDGTSRLLLRTGDVLTPGGRPVRKITALSTVLGSPGQTRTFNSTGWTIVRVVLTNGTEAIVELPMEPAQ